jgi:hypothetical protein
MKPVCNGLMAYAQRGKTRLTMPIVTPTFERINVHSVTVNLKRDGCSYISIIRHYYLLDLILKPYESVKLISYLIHHNFCFNGIFGVFFLFSSVPL